MELLQIMERLLPIRIPKCIGKPKIRPAVFDPRVDLQGPNNIRLLAGSPGDRAFPISSQNSAESSRLDSMDSSSFRASPYLRRSRSNLASSCLDETSLGLTAICLRALEILRARLIGFVTLGNTPTKRRSSTYTMRSDQDRRNRITEDVEQKSKNDEFKQRDPSISM